MGGVMGWAYKVVVIPKHQRGIGSPPGYDKRMPIEEVLNIFGADGWELVTIDDERHTAVFKRPVEGAQERAYAAGQP
jgi:Domain of unknown function (DUF4177)